jgi:muramoyltetrapeptide carboxypeptidase
LSELLKPPRLRPGATIGVANISGPVDEARLERGISRLRARGYRVVEADNVRRRDGFLAGTDDERAAGYRALLQDPSVEAIFFARGGYGASRILSRLDAAEVRSNPKIHLGGSDLTALFAFLRNRASLAAAYGPMVAVQIAGDDGSGAPELDWEPVLSGELPQPVPVAPEDVVVAGSAAGTLAGGCLSLLASLCGTPEQVDGKDAVLFWEDVGEEIYRLDRMLTQLERSGTFDRLQAMIIGSIAPGRREGAESPGEIRSWLAQRFAGAPFPVASGFPAGHVGDTRTLPLGTRVRVDLDHGTIHFLESAVA